MADNKGGSDLDVFEGLAKKSARPTTPGLAPPPPSMPKNTMLGGLQAPPPPPGPPGTAPLPPPSLPKPPGPPTGRLTAPGAPPTGALGPLPPLAPPPPTTVKGTGVLPPPSAPPPPLPPPAAPSKAASAPPVALPPPAPPPGPASLSTQLGVSEKKRSGQPAVDMDWDDEEESTHVYDKQNDGMPMPTKPGRGGGGQTAASKVGAAASLLAASGTAAKPSVAPTPLPVAPPQPPIPSAPPPSPSMSVPPTSRRDEPTAIRPRPVAPQQSGGKLGVILGGLALLVVLGLAAFLLIPRRGELTIDVKTKSGGPVAKAEIYVDGQKRCDTAPCVVKDLEAGSVAVKVLGPDFAMAEQIAQVDSGKKQILIVVEPSGQKAPDSPSATAAGLRVGGSQKGVKVFVDGADKGTLPLDLKDLTPGTHKLKLEAGERYEKIEQVVELAQGQTKDLGQIKLKVLKGQVTMELASAGAKVVITGETSKKKIEIADKAWRTPPVKEELDGTESWVVTATKKGFDDFKQTISFDGADAEQTLRIELFETGKAPPPSASTGPGPGPGPATTSTASSTASTTPTTSASATAQGGMATLNINSIPVSKVVLDGRPLGSTPKIGVSVPPGNHTVTFIHPEKGRKSVTVTVKAGETKTAATKF